MKAYLLVTVFASFISSPSHGFVPVQPLVDSPLTGSSSSRRLLVTRTFCANGPHHHHHDDDKPTATTRPFWERVKQRLNTVESSGDRKDQVLTAGLFGPVKKAHDPITYLLLFFLAAFRWKWLFWSPYYWFVVGFCIKWYRARYVFKIPVWDRQPNWNNIITSKEQEKDLKAFTCKKCGSTIFIAKTREFFFEGDTGIGGLGCFACGAKGKENFVMDRERIVEDVADVDDYFEYERPLDFVSRAERRKLLKEAQGDEERANQILLERVTGLKGTTETATTSQAPEASNVVEPDFVKNVDEVSEVVEESTETTKTDSIVEPEFVRNEEEITEAVELPAENASDKTDEVKSDSRSSVEASETGKDHAKDQLDTEPVAQNKVDITEEITKIADTVDLEVVEEDHAIDAKKVVDVAPPKGETKESQEPTKIDNVVESELVQSVEEIFATLSDKPDQVISKSRIPVETTETDTDQAISQLDTEKVVDAAEPEIVPKVEEIPKKTSAKQDEVSAESPIPVTKVEQIDTEQGVKGTQNEGDIKAASQNETKSTANPTAGKEKQGDTKASGSSKAELKTAAAEKVSSRAEKVEEKRKEKEAIKVKPAAKAIPPPSDDDLDILEMDL